MTDLADAAIAYEETVMPDDVDFAHIVNVTPCLAPRDAGRYLTACPTDY